MGIGRGIRGPARIELIRNHRLAVFTIDGQATVADVQVRAEKLKLLRRKRPRRYLPQRGINEL